MANAQSSLLKQERDNIHYVSVYRTRLRLATGLLNQTRTGRCKRGRCKHGPYDGRDKSGPYTDAELSFPFLRVGWLLPATVASGSSFGNVAM
jgi:hypothetical protein